MTAILAKLFQLLDSVTSPLKGKRTYLAAAGFAIAMLLATWDGNYSNATTNLLALLAILGLRLPVEPEQEGGKFNLYGNVTAVADILHLPPR